MWISKVELSHGLSWQGMQRGKAQWLSHLTVVVDSFAVVCFPTSMHISETYCG